MAESLDIVIVTGLSGSGKSFAIRAFEDNGFFCVDNLPALLIPKFIDLCQDHREGVARIALGVDLRGEQFLQSWPNVLAQMRTAGHHIQVLFFDASDDVLLRRFSETRRPHPLAGTESIQDGISRERKALEAMRALADKIIDTSDVTVHQLKQEIEQQFCQAPFSRRILKSRLSTSIGTLLAGLAILARTSDSTDTTRTRETTSRRTARWCAKTFVLEL